jgi:acyl carrier protein
LIHSGEIGEYIEGESNMTIEYNIKEYIADNLLFSSNGFKYSDETSFLEEGIVDSQGVMELVMFVEDKFHITVDDLDIVPDNFDSVNLLASYIRRKKGNN